MRRWLIVIIFVLAAVCGLATNVLADTDCGTDTGCLQKQIDDLTKSLQMSVAATTPLESEIQKLESRIGALQKQIDAAAVKQNQMEVDIKSRGQKATTQYMILAIKTREMYKRLRSEPLWVTLLTQNGLGEGRREMVYRQETNDKDRQLIATLISEIGQLETDKKTLEVQKVQLAKIQTDLDKQSSFFEGEVKKAKAYQADLSGKIAALSARQQAILAEKTGTFSTTVGDVPLADDTNSRPDFDPGFSPAFAAFSFGAPHFKGMSQYGAFGRAKSGQNADDILHAYYGGIQIKKDYDAGKQISVQVYGRMDIETYVKRIYEMPGSWGDDGGFEALKAQAVAARSYALAWTDQGNGGAICTSQDCQVYKNANKGGKWEEAVNATRGWVLWNNGKPFKAWYASTSGGYQQSYTDSYTGYTTPSLWDTQNGRNGWTSQAYEKIGGSPWFYKAWYRDSSKGDQTCGRSHPWFTAEEMADILNAWVVLKNGSDDRVAPQGGCWGGNPYSTGELRDKARNSGGGYERVTGVSVSYSDGGYTSKVHFETEKGGVDIDGTEFKKVFNLRAPGRIAIKSPLFNIERK